MKQLWKVFFSIRKRNIFVILSAHLMRKKLLKFQDSIHYSTYVCTDLNHKINNNKKYQQRAYSTFSNLFSLLKNHEKLNNMTASAYWVLLQIRKHQSHISFCTATERHHLKFAQILQFLSCILPPLKHMLKARRTSKLPYSAILFVNISPFKCDSNPLLTARMKLIILFIEIHLNTQLFKIMKFLLILFCQEEL